jgi:hypothetical protein
MKSIVNPSRDLLIRKFDYLVVVLMLLLLSGCAQHYTAEAYNDPYGFLSGILHGVLFPFSLIANVLSWFLSLLGINVLTDIQIIGRPNTGIFFYYIGFFIGLSAWGSSSAAR